MIECRLSFAVDNPELALDAMKPDLKTGVGRSNARFSTGKGKLLCRISSPDITAFRAAVNNYLRLIHTIEKVSQNEPERT